MVAIAVAVLFRFGPNVAVSFRWTLVGGLVFAVGWVAATALFSIYVANFANYANTYGALGGVIVLMLWFYLTALLLLVAAELMSVLVKDHEPEKADAAEPRRGRVARRGTPGVPSRAGPARRDGRQPVSPRPALPMAEAAADARRPSPALPQPLPFVVAEPALVVAREAAGAVTGADARPRLSVGKRAGRSRCSACRGGRRGRGARSAATMTRARQPDAALLAFGDAPRDDLRYAPAAVRAPAAARAGRGLRSGRASSGSSTPATGRTRSRSTCSRRSRRRRRRRQQRRRGAPRGFGTQLVLEVDGARLGVTHATSPGRDDGPRYPARRRAASTRSCSATRMSRGRRSEGDSRPPGS